MKKKTKILAICQSKIPSAVVGVIKSLDYLSKKGVIDFQFVESINVTKTLLAEIDTLICIRGAEEIELNIVSECKRLGKYIIYFIDDDLLNVPFSAKCSMYFNNEIIRNNIYKIMKLSHCLWTTNKNIDYKYRGFFERSVVLDAPALLLDSKEICCQNKENNKIVIGFCGGIDHKSFLEELLDDTIKVILDKYSNKVKFEFMGARPSFIEKYSLTYIPYQKDHKIYAEIIKSRGWDIGLAPLPKSEFHSCKYFNKFLEYGAIGAAGVYSNVEPYTYIIKNGFNGILVDNKTEDWIRAITYLIENRNVMYSIKINAKKQLERDFSISSIANDIISKIPELTEYFAPYCNEKKIKFDNRKKNKFIYKLLSILKREGIRAPIYIVKRILLKIKTNF
ncbi:Glycosyl transferases group 1 [Caloranaerobacter azorensis DSM 13643]|uniref:Glycosyl transferases group 1 n=1 Tax=Caloranaerobacter azorensis DSM 13643 TaxID=1121264 RepID=A0A1M5T026_9FIRM|nr:glycosyltransferase [Caloranaerobacter azorensis]SHH43958.1 Glycosyl transferases group 1 [Caloranaerobacter azorensis DSM 13643]